MRPLLTPEEMARADAATIDSGTPAEVLMERAGRAVARAVVDAAGGRYGRRALVVCGTGSNGGDGFVAARVCARDGMTVRCLIVGDPGRISGAAAHHLELWRQTGGGTESFEGRALPRSDVIVDALFGTGFRGRAEGDAARAIEAINEAARRGSRDEAQTQATPKVVAVDIPSGVDGTSGSADGPAVVADLTVAMAAQKTGTAVGRGAANAGEVRMAYIGIPVSATHTWMTDDADIRNLLPVREVDSHKRSHGAVAILGGAPGLSGAVVLAARGAVRMGAGYVTAGVSSATDQVLSSSIPEVLTRVVTDADTLGPETLDAFKEVIERADALAVGPGLGTGAAQASLVEQVLSSIDLPVVLDADGLNVLAGHTEALVRRSGAAVITPHPAELGRLVDLPVRDIQADRIGAARAAAHRFGCVVVLKGFRSVVAHHEGEVIVNPTGSAVLATAGTGDVLTGMVTALLAAGRGPFEAAWTAAYLHGVAGDVAAERVGVTGVIAGDVADAVPAAIERILDGGRP